MVMDCTEILGLVKSAVDWTVGKKEGLNSGVEL